MSFWPDEYLEIAAARQAELVLEAKWNRILRPQTSRRGSWTRPLRNRMASRLRWLADRLQVEPELLPAPGSS